MTTEQMLDSALERVSSQRILTTFRRELKSSSQRAAVKKKIEERITLEMRQVLEKLASGSFPEILELIELLPVALHRSRWGVYLRLALPLVPGLPIIVYIGSSCAMSLLVGGLAERAYTHLYNLSSGDKMWVAVTRHLDCQAALTLSATALLEDPSKYCVAFLEAWMVEDFDYLTASRRELFDTYSRSSSLATSSGIGVSGATSDDPLTQGFHLPAFATYHW